MRAVNLGVGFAIISQRPSKLDADVTSQCNTIITMRIKNPDDQRFIVKTSDMFSKADIDELPSLSTVRHSFVVVLFLLLY